MQALFPTLLVVVALAAEGKASCDLGPNCMVPVSADGTKLTQDANCNFIVNDDGQEYAFWDSRPARDGTLCKWNFVGPKPNSKVRINVNTFTTDRPGDRECSNTNYALITGTTNIGTGYTGNYLCKNFANTPIGANSLCTGQPIGVTYSNLLPAGSITYAFSAQVQTKSC